MSKSKVSVNIRSLLLSRSIALLVVLLGAAGLTAYAQYQTCPECSPTRLPGVNTQGSKKVCTDIVLTADDVNKIKAGATWWNERMSTRTPYVYFDFAAPGDTDNCNLVVTVNYSLLGTSTAAQTLINTNGDGQIQFNPDRLANETFQYISYVSGHEFYHVLGWDDYPEGSPLRSECDAKSMMAGSYHGHPGLPGDMDCGDRVPVGSTYQPNSGVNCATDPGHPDCSPLLIDTRGDGFEFTWARNGVLFDVDGDGTPEMVGWTQRNSDDAWLAWDRNGNGTIDSGAELFGNATRGCFGETAANGFEALKMFEDPCYGPSVKDGIIDANDAVFQRLLLWRDLNKDGQSTPEELTPVSQTPLRAINANYTNVSRERKGNVIRQASLVTWGNGRRCIVDVWLDTIEPD